MALHQATLAPRPCARLSGAGAVRPARAQPAGAAPPGAPPSGGLPRGALAAAAAAAALWERPRRAARGGCPRLTAVRQRATSGPEVGALKEALFGALKSRGRDTKDPQVVAAVEALAKVSPTEAAAQSGTFLDGTWEQVSKSSFPGEIDDEVYTLGRLTFSIYSPKDMLWKIDRTVQEVRPVEGAEAGTRTWDAVLDLVCVDENYPKFKAKFQTVSFVKPDADKDDRLEVWFTGGVLKPSPQMDSALLPEWRKIFKDSLSEQKSNATFFSKVGDWLMGKLMGLKKPDSVSDDGSMTYEMTKAPHGHTDVLYLDDDLRITKGNKGSIVVATR